MRESVQAELAVLWQAVLEIIDNYRLGRFASGAPCQRQDRELVLLDSTYFTHSCISKLNLAWSLQPHLYLTAEN